MLHMALHYLCLHRVVAARPVSSLAMVSVQCLAWPGLMASSVGSGTIGLPESLLIARQHHPVLLKEVYNITLMIEIPLVT